MDTTNKTTATAEVLGPVVRQPQNPKKVFFKNKETGEVISLKGLQLQRARVIRKAMKKAVKETGSPGTACCHRCHTWFKTLEERNYHKAFTCPKRPGAGKVATIPLKALEEKYFTKDEIAAIQKDVAVEVSQINTQTLGIYAEGEQTASVVHPPSHEE